MSGGANEAAERPSEGDEDPFVYPGPVEANGRQNGSGGKRQRAGTDGGAGAIVPKETSMAKPEWGSGTRANARLVGVLSLLVPGLGHYYGSREQNDERLGRRGGYWLIGAAFVWAFALSFATGGTFSAGAAGGVGGPTGLGAAAVVVLHLAAAIDGYDLVV